MKDHFSLVGERCSHDQQFSVLKQRARENEIVITHLLTGLCKHYYYQSCLANINLTQFNGLCSLKHGESHHQSINVPTAWARAFLLDYLQGEQAVTYHADPV
jgi:hypothetical protein